MRTVDENAPSLRDSLRLGSRNPPSFVSTPIRNDIDSILSSDKDLQSLNRCCRSIVGRRRLEEKGAGDANAQTDE